MAHICMRMAAGMVERRDPFFAGGGQIPGAGDDAQVVRFAAGTACRCRCAAAAMVKAAGDDDLLMRLSNLDDARFLDDGRSPEGLQKRRNPSSPK
ncbi:hypothetical protein ACIBKY_34610 [Nonomuraea sp. NPDC050394]|uniref:hypothetical protein n=1 Tax=Nonomuraea sp. NPDC050394 TaxID=3364363 RepID=UPI00379A8519